MKLALKKAICDWIFANIHEFQLTSACLEHFHPYIWTPDGKEELIGGKEVCDFIEAECKLILHREED